MIVERIFQYEPARDDYARTPMQSVSTSSEERKSVTMLPTEWQCRLSRSERHPRRLYYYGSVVAGVRPLEFS